MKKPYWPQVTDNSPTREPTSLLNKQVISENPVGIELETWEVLLLDGECLVNYATAALYIVLLSCLHYILILIISPYMFFTPFIVCVHSEFLGFS